jgi:GDP-L-fucose synthase
MTPESRIFVVGHTGMAGAAICRRLRRDGFNNLILRTRGQLDLRDQQAVDACFTAERPEYVFLAAAKTGGILAHGSSPAEFTYDNLAIQTNLIHSSWKHGVRKLLFFGSSAAYPKDAPQPMPEELLLTGPLDPAHEYYSVAKIAGIKLAQAYRKQYGFQAVCVMPPNLYGPGERFDPATSNVLQGLVGRFAEARATNAPEVVVWGTGNPRREFLHVDDLADASVSLMHNSGDLALVNVGAGTDLSIRELAELVRRVAGYEGALKFDASKPDGVIRKLLDVSRMTALGWRPAIPLERGIRETYLRYCALRPGKLP